jgi:serine/threonine-protein kinase
MNATSLTEPCLPRPGDHILDRYVVESMLAAGGMGVVFKARHELLAERFAIKVLHPDMLGSSEVVSRFLREAQACVTLRGEHAVRVFDVGTMPNGLPFMVMELLTGHDLRRELQERGPLPVEEAATWALQACQSLAEAHARGIVHRDIKPSNLFLSQQPDGRRIVKLIDFGISKVPSEANPNDTELTRNVGLLGSPQYMSPEQVRSASSVDHRSDIWSLGAVLYESLVGMPPFGGESVTAVAAMIVADDATPLERLRPELPEGLSQAVTRCLVKERGKRLQSVAELAELLEPFAIEAPTPSGRVSRILSHQSTVASASLAGITPLDVGSEQHPRVRFEPPTLARPLPELNRPESDGASRKTLTLRRGALLACGALALVGLLLVFFLGPGASELELPKASPRAAADALVTPGGAKKVGSESDDARRQAPLVSPEVTPTASAAPSTAPASVSARFVPNSDRVATEEPSGRTNGEAREGALSGEARGNKLDDILSDRQ